MGKHFLARNSMTLIGVLLVVACGLFYYLVAARTKAVWEGEVLTMLHKGIRIGMPRKKVEAWLTAQRRVPTQPTFYYKKDESKTTVYIPTDSLKAKTWDIYDMAAIDLVFDSQDKLLRYEDSRLTRVGLP